MLYFDLRMSEIILVIRCSPESPVREAICGVNPKYIIVKRMGLSKESYWLSNGQLMKTFLLKSW